MHRSFHIILSMRRFLLPLFTITLLLVSVPVPAADTPLPKPVRQAMAKYSIPGSAVSLVVKPLDDDRPLLSVAAGKIRSPASTIKLLTTFTALDLLGGAYQWQTESFIDGQLARGVLDGNLYLKGSGDPFLVAEKIWLLLAEIRRRGVREIRGDIVVDNGIFSVEPVDSAAFDSKPWRAYNVGPDGFLLNFKVTRFLFYPDPSQQRIVIEADPPNSTLQIVNRMRYTTQACAGRNKRIRMQVLERRPAKVQFSGRLSRHCQPREVLRAVQAQNDYVTGVLSALWRQLGGKLEGGVRFASLPEKARSFSRHYSPTLAEQIRSINKFSNNVMARQLLLTLAAEFDELPGTTEGGARVIRDYLERHAITAPGLVIQNGSGLSRKTRISAGTMAAFLEFAYFSAWRPEFLASLPLLSIDGSLQRRSIGEVPGENFRLKTGLIDHVRALAGYVTAADGTEYVVVLLLNHGKVHYGSGNAVQEALLKWLYRHESS